MRAERRTQALALMGIVTVSLGVLAEQPVLIVAGVPFAAWLIGRQATAVRTLRELDAALTVDVRATRRSVSVEEDIDIAVSARTDTPAPAPVEITVPLPVAADGPGVEGRTLSLEPGEQEASMTFECSFPTAGSFDFPTPELTITPVDGLFTETLRRGSIPSITAEPRTPRDLQVGQGGEALALAYGEHPAGRGGGGLSPEELRPYQPGDTADRIDWKATARIGDLYVREFEAETDRRTVLVVDHRSDTALGDPGADLFAYLREVALGFVDATESASDPLGCWTVGDRGITGRYPPTSAAAGYDRIRTHLRELTTTDTATTTPNAMVTAAAANGAGETAHANGQPTAVNTSDHALVRPAAATVRHDRLRDDDSPLATRLSPFLGARTSYVERLERDPLFGTVERIRTEIHGSRWSVLLTDDGEREQIRETIRLATRNGNHAIVFLAPRVLFEQNALADIDTAYERYVEFEEFRRTLDGLPRVTAFEVGPGDRLDRLLATRRRHRG